MQRNEWILQSYVNSSQDMYFCFLVYKQQEAALWQGYVGGDSGAYEAWLGEPLRIS